MKYRTLRLLASALALILCAATVSIFPGCAEPGKGDHVDPVSGSYGPVPGQSGAAGPEGAADVTAADETTTGLTTADINAADITTSEVTTADAAATEVTTADVTASDVTTADVTTADVTTADVTTAEVTTAEVTTAEVTTAEVTTAEVTTAEVTTAEVTTAEVTTAEVTTAEVTTAVNTGATPETTPVTAQQTTPPPTPVTGPADGHGLQLADDGLPVSADYGRTFTVRTGGGMRYEWEADESCGTALNEAVFRRNAAVKERFNIGIDVVADGSDWKKIAGDIQKSILAGTGAYDLIAGYDGLTRLATAGMLYDLEGLEFIDLDRPWWNDSFRAETEIGGRNYFAVGPISLSMLSSMQCIFFNSDILREADSSFDICQTVRNGGWTADELARLAAAAWIDRDADNRTTDADRLGFTFNHNSYNTLAFLYASGFDTTPRDADGLPTLPHPSSLRLNDVVERIHKLLYTGKGVMHCHSISEPDISEGNTLFFFGRLKYALNGHASRAENCGFVPVPKITPAQDRYYTPVDPVMNMYCIPADVTNIEEDQVITEALAAGSHRTLLPEFFDAVTKGGYSKGSELSQMPGLMYGNLVFDFSLIYRADAPSYPYSLQSALSSGEVSDLYLMLKTEKNQLEKTVMQLLDIPD